MESPIVFHIQDEHFSSPVCRIIHSITFLSRIHHKQHAPLNCNLIQNCNIPQKMSIFYKQTHVCLDRGIHEVWRELDLAVSFLGGTNKACIFHNFAGRTISTFFNHTLNEIPQSLFPITRFDKKTPLGCPLGRLKFSMASLSNTSSITF